MPSVSAPCFACILPLFFPNRVMDTAWVRRYSGPGNGDDKAVAIAVDSGGSVYVTGSSFDSTTGYDYTTIKYLPNGDTGWVRRYNGPASKYDYAVGLAMDKNGNVYVTGTAEVQPFLGGYGSFNIVTVKYFPNGDTAWVRGEFIAATDRPDFRSLGLVMDGHSNVYIAGEAFHPLYGLYGFTIKYDSAGNEAWGAPRTLSAPSNALSPIAVDSIGSNVCVIGFDGIFEYDSLGNEIWTQSFPGRPQAVDLDNVGNIYVVGESGYNFVLIKYDSTGDSLWVRSSNVIPGWNEYRASLVATDKNNNSYVTGTIFAAPDGMAWFTKKYDPAGNQLWFQVYNGIGLGTGRESKAMELDSSGNIYVTGYDAIILKENDL